MNIYFWCCPQDLEKRTGFDHHIICLAEGFLELGYNIFGNRDYWRISATSNTYLVNEVPGIYYGDCDLVIFTTKYLVENSDELSDDIYRSDRDYKIVCIDGHDGLITPSYEVCDKVDIVLKCHYNIKFDYPQNYKPWQFGLSNRIIRATSKVEGQRSANIIVNYRVHHAVRKKAMNALYSRLTGYYQIVESINSINDEIRSFNSEDKLSYLQTGSRHYSDYYQRLCRSLGCFTFGGFLTNRFMVTDHLIIKVIRRLNYDLELIMNDRIFQWDSWRLWETLASGAVAFHVDFERYGILLPVQPICGKHYVGIDFQNLDDFSELISDTERLYNIGKSGRRWALENYSPKAVANRLIQMITD